MSMHREGSQPAMWRRVARRLLDGRPLHPWEEFAWADWRGRPVGWGALLVPVAACVAVIMLANRGNLNDSTAPPPTPHHISHFRVRLDAAAIGTAQTLIRAEYLDRSCRGVRGLYPYKYYRVWLGPGDRCPAVVADQKGYGNDKYWFVQGS